MQDVSHSVLQEGVVRKCPVSTLVRNDPASCSHSSGDCSIQHPDRQERKLQRDESVSGGHAAQGETDRDRCVSHALPRVLLVAVSWYRLHHFSLRREFFSVHQRRTLQSGPQDVFEIVCVLRSSFPRRRGHRTHMSVLYAPSLGHPRGRLPLEDGVIGTEHARVHGGRLQVEVSVRGCKTHPVWLAFVP